MARTYWKPHADGTFEFLGVFADNHQARPKTPQADGRILDITDKSMGEVDALLALADRPAPPRLVDLPSAIAKRFQARIVVTLPWNQVEGYVK